MFEMMASFVLGDHLSGETFDPPLGPPGYMRMLNAHRRPFPTNDGYLCVMIYTDRHWRAFFLELGREAEFEQDPRYASMTTRSQHIAALYEELGDLLRTQTTAHWLALFERADVPAMPLHTMQSLIEDAHLAETGFFGRERHPSEGLLRQMRYPSTWSVSQPSPARPAPRLGEHSVEVLREIGYDEAKIAALLGARVTATATDEDRH